jgi:hypothetical protein
MVVRFAGDQAPVGSIDDRGTGAKSSHDWTAMVFAGAAGVVFSVLSVRAWFSGVQRRIHQIEEPVAAVRVSEGLPTFLRRKDEP